jgi:hypothetical protein
LSLTENKHPDKPLKVLEQLGKEVLTEYLEKLVQSNVLKLKEEDKQKFNNAERSDKRWVFVDAMKKKHSKVGEMLLQTFFSVDPGSHHGEGKSRMYCEQQLRVLMICSIFRPNTCFGLLIFVSLSLFSKIDNTLESVLTFIGRSQNPTW